MTPNDGPAYSVVDQVRWDCSREALPEVVKALEGAFRSAPEDTIAQALFKLRIMTRAREQRTEEMIEAEAVIWIEQLRTYPGDVVLEVLKGWTSPGNPNGKWWPTWHEIAAKLERACDKRQALLNFVKALAERPEPVQAITDQPPTLEQRKAAVERYEREIRPSLAAKENATVSTEAPEAALERLMASKDAPVAIGGALLKKIEQIKAGA